MSFLQYLTESSRLCLNIQMFLENREHSWKMAKEFQPTLPNEFNPVAIFNRENAIPLHQVGRYKLANEIKDAQKGDLVFAGDYLSCATVEGAIRSGRWAAYKLMDKKISTF